MAQVSGVSPRIARLIAESWDGHACVIEILMRPRSRSAEIALRLPASCTRCSDRDVWRRRAEREARVRMTEMQV
jgi:hypothetical protein